MKIGKLELLLRAKLAHDPLGRGMLGCVDGARMLGAREDEEVEWLAEALLQAARIEPKQPWPVRILDWKRPSVRLSNPLLSRAFWLALPSCCSWPV